MSEVTVQFYVKYQATCSFLVSNQIFVSIAVNDFRINFAFNWMYILLIDNVSCLCLLFNSDSLEVIIVTFIDTKSFLDRFRDLYSKFVFLSPIVRLNFINYLSLVFKTL